MLHHLAAQHAANLTGRSFFPKLISKPFQHGLHAAFDFAIVACLIAAAASWLRGGHYVHDLHAEDATAVESMEGETALDVAPAERVPIGR